MIDSELKGCRIKFVVDVGMMIDMYTEYTALLNKITENRKNLHADIIRMIDLHMPGYGLIDEATGEKFSSKDKVIDNEQQ